MLSRPASASAGGHSAGLAASCLDRRKAIGQLADLLFEPVDPRLRGGKVGRRDARSALGCGPPPPDRRVASAALPRGPDLRGQSAAVAQLKALIFGPRPHVAHRCRLRHASRVAARLSGRQILASQCGPHRNYPCAIPATYAAKAWRHADRYPLRGWPCGRRAGAISLRAMTTALRRIAPVFIMTDLSCALAHYERLGFTVEAYEGGDFYGYACRDGLEIHLAKVGSIDRSRNSCCTYLWVDDALALHEEWAAAVVEGRLDAPANTDYGLDEGAHVDPDGNLIRVGSPPLPTGALR